MDMSQDALNLSEEMHVLMQRTLSGVWLPNYSGDCVTHPVHLFALCTEMQLSGLTVILRLLYDIGYLHQ